MVANFGTGSYKIGGYKMAKEQVVKDLLSALGGADNVESYMYCATRLRVVVKDEDLVDKEKAESVAESQGYFFNSGQHQFIFGTGKVNEVHQAFKEKLEDEGMQSTEEDKSFKDSSYAKLSIPQKLVRILSDVLVPLIPALVTTGLLMGLRGLLVELGMEMTPEWTTFFQMLTDTAFAFLPVLITYSAAVKFGANPILGIVVGLMLVAPQLPNAYAVAGGDAAPLTILGINIIGYQGSIFPGIIAGWLIAKFEKSLRKIVPQVMDLVVTPFLAILGTLVIVLFIVGPILQIAEGWVIDSVVWLVEAPLGIGYIIYGAFQQLLVVTGLHHSLSVIEISLLSDTGMNVLNALGTASMAGQFGAAVGTAFLMKDKVRRSNMLSSAVPTLFGITEPLLFGVNLRSFNIIGSGVVGGAVGGLIIYIFQLSASGMGITFIPGLLLYTSSISSMVQYILVILAAFAVGFILVQMQKSKIVADLQ